MSAWFGSSWSSVVAWTMAHSLWMGVCICALALALFELARPRSAGSRYAWAAAAFWALPLFTLLALVFEFLTHRGPQVAVLVEPAAFASGVRPEHWMQSLRTWFATRGSGLESWIFLAWLLGSGAMALRLLWGWMCVRRFARSHLWPAEPLWQARVVRLGRKLGLRRRVRLYASSRIDVPMVIGGASPRIVVPWHSFRTLSTERLESLIAHELAHVRRLDGPVHLLQQLIVTLFFFHPAVWWLQALVRRERENCCDELALSCGVDRLCLARALTDLEGSRSVDRAWLALAADDGVLFDRVRRIVGGPPEPARPVRRMLAGGAALLAVAGLAIGAAPTHAPLELFVRVHSLGETGGTGADVHVVDSRTVTIDTVRIAAAPLLRPRTVQHSLDSVALEARQFFVLQLDSSDGTTAFATASNLSANFAVRIQTPVEPGGSVDGPVRRAIFVQRD